MLFHIEQSHADDIAHLQAFLKPGAGRTLCETTPVSDRPVTPNN